MTFRVDLEKKGETVSKISFSLKIHLSKNLVNYTLEDITIDIITRNIFSGVHLKILRGCSSIYAFRISRIRDNDWH